MVRARQEIVPLTLTLSLQGRENRKERLYASRKESVIEFPSPLTGED